MRAQAGAAPGTDGAARRGRRWTGPAAIIGACLLWGLSPAYFHALQHVPPLAVIAHRVLWSLLLFAALLALRGELPLLARALATPRLLLRVALAAAMLCANWLLFLIAVYAGHVVQTSLGYFIFPLLSVLVGVAAFGERLAPVQWLAVALAGAAVLVMSLGAGGVPWLSLAIGASFAVYGAVKKGLPLPALVSVTAEMAVLAPLAAAWLALGPDRAAPGFGSDTLTSLLLVGSALLTAVPLMLFSLAAQRIGLATVGVLQYLNPTLQFLVATLWFREPFGAVQLLAFGLIWTALALYSGAALARRPRLPGAQARL